MINSPHFKGGSHQHSSLSTTTTPVKLELHTKQDPDNNQITMS